MTSVIHYVYERHGLFFRPRILSGKISRSALSVVAFVCIPFSGFSYFVRLVLYILRFLFSLKPKCCKPRSFLRFSFARVVPGWRVPFASQHNFNLLLLVCVDNVVHFCPCGKQNSIRLVNIFVVLRTRGNCNREVGLSGCLEEQLRIRNINWSSFAGWYIYARTQCILHRVSLQQLHTLQNIQ